MNKTILASLMATGFLVAGIGTAHADASTSASSPESSPQITTPQPTPTTTSTTVAPATTTSTTVVAEPSPAQARARLVELVNGERVGRGLQALEVRGDVTDVAMGWSGSMAQAAALSHNDAYFSEESRRRLDARVLGENVARAGSIEQAHEALMASAHHRDNILDARFSAVGFGAVFSGGSWWVTEDFLQTHSASAPAPAPAHAPAAANAGGRGVERARVATPAPTVQVHAASASNEVLAAVAPAEQLVLVPTTMMPPVASPLAGEALPDRQLRFAVVAVTLLLLASLAAVHKATRRAVRLAAPTQRHRIPT